MQGNDAEDRGAAQGSAAGNYREKHSQISRCPVRGAFFVCGHREKGWVETCVI
jgi:hypothetical protein